LPAARSDHFANAATLAKFWKLDADKRREIWGPPGSVEAEIHSQKLTKPTMVVEMTDFCEEMSTPALGSNVMFPVSVG
jgi:hypothetical protein